MLVEILTIKMHGTGVKICNELSVSINTGCLLRIWIVTACLIKYFHHEKGPNISEFIYGRSVRSDLSPLCY
jgi:hypothetical protein